MAEAIHPVFDCFLNRVAVAKIASDIFGDVLPAFDTAAGEASAEAGSTAPASVSALVHWSGAGISFLSLMIAIFLLSGCFKRNTRWRSIYRLSYIWLAIIVLALVAYGALSLLDWTGIGERIYIAACMLWLLLVSLRLRAITIYLKGEPAHVERRHCAASRASPRPRATSRNTSSSVWRP